MPKRILSRSFTNEIPHEYDNPGHYSCSMHNSTIKTVAENIYLTVEKKLADEDYYYYNNNDINNININHPTDHCFANIINDQSEKIINKFKATGGIGSILSEQQLDMIYDNFIKPYNEDGPQMLPATVIFNAIYNYVSDKIQDGNESNTLLKMIRDTLSILLDGRNRYIDNIRCDNELSFIKDKYLESLVIINDLRKELMSGTDIILSSTILQLEGSINLEINQPPPIIYAQATLDLNMAWYIYLYSTNSINNNEFCATINYVNSLGTHEEAYNMLVRLLDEKFATIYDDINDNEDNS